MFVNTLKVREGSSLADFFMPEQNQTKGPTGKKSRFF